MLREGRDAAIITCGMLVSDAAEDIQVRVVDMFTIKPIDRRCVLESARLTGAIVTASLKAADTLENHQVIGGLGSAVSEVLAEHVPTPLERVGVKDVFGEVGPQDYLMEHFGLTASHIAEAVKKVIRRKSV